MADQDFNINVRTTADLAGVAKTEAALSDLQRRAAQIGPGGALSERDAAARAAVGAEGGVGPLLGKIEHGFTRLALHAAGIGAVFGLIEQVKRIAEELNKAAEAAAKVSIGIIQNSQNLAEAARSARSEADIIKIGSEGIKDRVQLQKEVNLHAGDELDIYHKITDELYHQLAIAFNRKEQSKDAARISKQALEEEQKLRQQNLDLADQEARGALRTARANEQAFEKRKAQPFSEAVSGLASDIDTLRAKQNALDQSSKSYVKDWLEIAKKIQEAEKSMEELDKLERERTQFQKENLKEFDKFKLAGQETAEKLSQITKELDAIGVKAKTPAEAFEAGAKMAGLLGEKVRALALEWAKLQNELTEEAMAPIKKMQDSVLSKVFTPQKTPEFLTQPAGKGLESALKEMPEFANLPQVKGFQKHLDQLAKRDEADQEFLDEIDKGRAKAAGGLQEQVGLANRGGSPDVVAAINKLVALWQ